MDKGREAASEEKQNKQDKRGVGRIGLERSGPREFLLAIDSLPIAGVDESQIDNADGDPVDQGRDGDEILQPGEDCASRVGQGHVSQGHEEAIEGNSDIGDTESVDTQEY